MKKFKLNLQLFAEPNLNVQTTTRSGVDNDLTIEMKTYYDKQLLEDAKPNLVHNQFGQKRPIPRNGGKTIEWRKFSALPIPSAPLTEGVTPDGNNLNPEAIYAEVVQYGAFIAQSDVLELTSIDNTILEATKILGNQAGLTIDTLIRDQLASCKNVLRPNDIKTRAELTLDSKISVDLIYQAVRNLKRQNAPKIGDSYVAIIHPDVAYDLMRCDEWIDAHKYATPENLYNGEIGKIAGVRFVESTQAKIKTGEDPENANNNCPNGCAVYFTFVLGEDAYGIVDIEGGGLEHIIKQKGSGGTSDPLNQRSTIGWKTMMTAKVLDDSRIVRIETASSYSGSASAN